MLAPRQAKNRDFARATGSTSIARVPRATFFVTPVFLAPGTVVAILGNRVAPPFAFLEVFSADDGAERAAFTALYERQAPRIHRFLRDLLGDAALAADATQETFARAYQRHRDVLRDEERAVPWLFGVARNVSL